MANQLIEHVRGLPVGQRKILLEQNADKIERGKYQKVLTIEEVEGRYQTIAINAKDIYTLQEEKKEVMAEFKEKLDPVVKRNNILIQEIKTGQTTVDGILYHMANHVDGMMETYDELGELVSMRRLLPNEKQLTLNNPLRKTADES